MMTPVETAIAEEVRHRGPVAGVSTDVVRQLLITLLWPDAPGDDVVERRLFSRDSDMYLFAECRDDKTTSATRSRPEQS